MGFSNSVRGEEPLENQLERAEVTERLPQLFGNGQRLIYAWKSRTIPGIMDIVLINHLNLAVLGFGMWWRAGGHCLLLGETWE